MLQRNFKVLISRDFKFLKHWVKLAKHGKRLLEVLQAKDWLYLKKFFNTIVQEQRYCTPIIVYCKSIISPCNDHPVFKN